MLQTPFKDRRVHAVEMRGPLEATLGLGGPSGAPTMASSPGSNIGSSWHA